jgi:DNA-binding transcriptional MerR regulator
MRPIASSTKTKNEKENPMSEELYRLPNEVATSLEISPSTLRRWSNEFGDFLSDPAAGGQSTHRRYTDEDLETLMTIKALLGEGLTYVQVAKRLQTLRVRQATGDVRSEGDVGEVTALGPSLLNDPLFAPSVSVLADTLHNVSEGQQLLMGSQQANRDLLTVVVQDNFTLKEENAKLRDRMLELEREIVELRRLDQARRETMDDRFYQLEARLRQPPPPTPRRSQRSGCLGQFFG